MMVEALRLLVRLRRHNRDRVGDPPGRVGRPRHALVYEPAADGAVNIVGLIPDRVPPPIAFPVFIPER